MSVGTRRTHDRRGAGAVLGGASVSMRRDSRSRVRIFTRLRAHRTAWPALLLAALLAGCGGSSGNTPLVHARTTPLESIFEAGPSLRADPAGTLDTLRKLGVDRVKVFLPWGDIAPDPTSRIPPPGFNAGDPAAYPAANWALYDTIIRNAKARGLGIDLTVGEPPPLWAAGPGAPRGIHPQWKPSPSDFDAFVRAVGTRYSGRYTPPGASAPLPRVAFWSIWNEPNYGPDLKPQAIDHWQIEVSPHVYRGLLDAAWTALHATGHGHDTILIGELAPRGVQAANGMVPLRFVRALYCVDASFKPLQGVAAAERGCPATTAGSKAFPQQNPALFHATGFADHPYPQGQTPPNFVTPGEPDYADFATLGALATTLDRVQAVYGSPTRFPIWSTEFGYKTDPPLALQASPAQAAALLNWSEYLTWRNPRLRSYDQYQLEDPPSSSTSKFVTGLEFAGGQPKATFYAYRMPLYLPQTSFPAGQAIEVWGSVRPARFAKLVSHRDQRVRIQFQRSGRRRFSTVATVTLTDPYGYFDVHRTFPGTGAVRLAWSYPHGPQIFSRTVAVVAH
jgi:hypothetical protein